MLRDASVYESGGSISFCRRCRCGGESLLDDDSTPNTPDTCSALLYIYTYLFSRLRGHDALKLLDSKYTLVIGGCGKECKAVCLAPTFERELCVISDSDTREVQMNSASGSHGSQFVVLPPWTPQPHCRTPP